MCQFINISSIKNTRAITKNDEYPLIAKILLLIIECQSEMTCTNFINGQQLCGNSMNHDQNIISTSLLYIASIFLSLKKKIQCKHSFGGIKM